ncbi:MAG: hypothetical protein NTY51_11115 [Deltaproteobacteria bacterium]|nr:hypothetical protein [Deltaproteobacteria bacterium]
MKEGSILKAFKLSGRNFPPNRMILLVACFIFCWSAGCGVINPGKWKGIESTSSDEQYYLVKDVFLSPGSAYAAKDSFDHNVNESVNIFFTPRNETNQYTAETIWYDPSDQEFRKIRNTYDTKTESKQGINRDSKGTTRVQSMPTRQLFNHKPGLWKIELFLDGKLARRLTFTVR